MYYIIIISTPGHSETTVYLHSSVENEMCQHVYYMTNWFMNLAFQEVLMVHFNGFVGSTGSLMNTAEIFFYYHV